MSCIILGTENLNIISDFLELQLNFGFNNTQIDISENLKNIFKDCMNNFGEYKAEKIFYKLHEENLKAYYGRYDRGPLTEHCIYYKENETIKNYHNYKKWYIELYKRLQCYIYQLCEDATINGDIYKELNILEFTLAQKIIDKYVSEYNEIPWI